MSVLFAVLGIWAGDGVVRIWASKVTPPERNVLAWLALWLVAQAFVNAAGVLLCGLSRNRLVMWTALGEGALTMLASVVLVRQRGIEGVAIAMSLSGVLAAFFLNAYAVGSATEHRVRPDLGSYVRIATCGFIAI